MFTLFIALFTVLILVSLLWRTTPQDNSRLDRIVSNDFHKRQSIYFNTNMSR